MSFLRKCWNLSTRVIRVQRRNVSAGRDSSSPMVLHEGMSASTLHLGILEICYPPARLCRNTQWYGACLPHIMKPCTRGHSPRCGFQQLEANKDPWCFFELLITHQFQKRNSGENKKLFSCTLPRTAQCFPFCASIAATLSHPTPLYWDTAKKTHKPALKFFPPYVTNWSLQSMSQNEFTF